MEDLNRMMPMEIAVLLVKELKSINQRIEKIEKILGDGKIPIGKKVFTVPEAQVYLDLSKSQIYKLTSTNKISFYKTGKRIYFKREHLDDYLTQNYMRSEQETDRLANEYLKKNPLEWRF